jgi:hypothetical protein
VEDEDDEGEQEGLRGLLIVFIARKEKEENSSCFDFSV